MKLFAVIDSSAGSLIKEHPFESGSSEFCSVKGKILQP